MVSEELYREAVAKQRLLEANLGEARSTFRLVADVLEEALGVGQALADRRLEDLLQRALYLARRESYR